MTEYSLSHHNYEYRHPKEPWGGVTDPRDHSDSAFRYLTLPWFTEDNDATYFPASLEQPEQKVLVLSLIDQDHVAGPDSGFIVEVGEGNVLSTSQHSTNFYIEDLGRMAARAQKYGVMSGDTLLRYTHPDTSNEVVAITKPTDSDMHVIKGIFARAGSHHTLRQTLHDTAIHRGLPFITLPEQATRYPVVSSDERPGQLNREADYDAVPLPSPKAVESVLRFALDTRAINEEQAEQVVEAYKIADEARQAGQIEFREDGTVDKIVRYERHGPSVHVTTINHDGLGYRTRQVKASANEQTLQRYQQRTPIPPREAISILENACRSLGPYETAIAKQWMNDTLPTIKRRWNDFIEARTRVAHSYQHDTDGIDTVLDIFSRQGNV